jgi:plastocyanin
MLRSVVRTIAAGSVAAAIFACGGSSDNSTGPTPVFTSVSVTPAAPTVNVTGTIAMSAVAKDQNGATFPGSTGVTWSSSDLTVATVNTTTGLVTGVANGNSTISASITIGSVTHSGSQGLAVNTPAATGNVAATTGLAFDPSAVTVLRDAGTSTITWHFQAVAHTVTWDTQPGSVTDIAATAGANVSRDFTVAGVYHYHCSIHPNMTGTITVE